MGKNILVVDDMQAQRDLMSNYLSRAGYNVTTAESGAEALVMVKANKPDIVVTDLVMPEITGLELCRELKRQPDTAAIPVVACTTKDRKMDQNWARKQGVAAYVVKPCTEQELVDAVRSVV
ncbi:response regulator [Leptolyngbyaceae cyanobacterium CCMR0082]|uniref:Response regulator n=2 Tax=Adonisia turfae TaxID=2950184 RepID=A0A6M0S6F3_9CYAN|nr:response regulator [Adonisia turfae]EKU99530.1 response regulator with CheY-like receiver, AAA-type ATPase, and DNA-binding domains [Leptolyngbya sp. PCC 7375]MDV3348886.1 response regulator [Leptothoe sp. LEGE 181152]NEZ57332.1 response regulator [Adonisia turfae CCMR0081]NEZ64027.1 response regulator [Adonisia turfae CCMR0082]